jgi:hypothetical protein
MDINPVYDAVKGLGITLLEGIKAYFPPSMTPQERASIELALSKAASEREVIIREAANAATTQFNERIKEMEGTASDLKSIPFLGAVILFLRGCQRPFWGFACAYFDWEWFTSPSPSTLTDRQQLALLFINILVLTFLFGERALQNLAPLIDKILVRFLGGASDGQ